MYDSYERQYLLKYVFLIECVTLNSDYNIGQANKPYFTGKFAVFGSFFINRTIN